MCGSIFCCIRTFFVELEKLSDKQKERIENAKEKRAEEKKEQAAKARKKTYVQANSLATSRSQSPYAPTARWK